jgi:hypothetical protein
MRLRWVGDARDYVKWDCVFEHSNGRYVFYVPMLRQKVDSRCRHPEVQCHFDQRKNLRQFSDLFPGRFDVFEYSEQDYSKALAEEYFGLVRKRMAELQNEHKVLVFLDPDTGIEPEGGGKDEHLRMKDLGFLFGSLKSGDKLIVYQHASRTRVWKENLLMRAGQRLGIEPTVELNLYFNEKMAKDVCFLVLDKS